MKQKILYNLKLLVSAGLLLYLVEKVDIKSVYLIMLNARIHYLIFAGVLIYIDVIINATLIKMAVAAKGFKDSLLRFVEMYLVSGFWGSFLPSSMGPDVAVTYNLSKASLSVTDALASMFAVRLYTSLPLFVFALLGAIYIAAVFEMTSKLPVVIGFVCTAFFTAFVAMVNKKLLNSIINLLRSYKNSNIISKINEFFKSYTGLHKGSIISNVLLLSFMSKTLSVICVYSVALALNINAPFIYFFAFVPVITVVTMLPLSISGIGVREASFAYLFSYAGMPAEQSISVSVILFAVLMLVNITGGSIYFTRLFLKRLNKTAHMGQ